ncbi:ZIP family metal transporter [Rossellomorea marisflavi]|jgi:zinc transporter, ZIP family|uniref:Dihydroorotate dehydrogenase n=1 Tax=Rossellomorea marisflavi TaxID=189381 RepID=A0A0M0G774_9BACI|nr:ZIP family metal transporter [Rossellomorea marisflavi]KQU62895.1 dihydroorotate dehydrogenase [Bacillus sp. Leaf406]MBV6686249.1 ZIP family metal transporter [Bacillus sp. JRC01]VXC55296.1 Dihydroorotate dehydrogenase [Bacillus sp. 349Y]KON85276.1 dihydroorotate dehydrogenase [Rossellomorea marisflavi]MCM2591120.1 ZIP family metal transporter [Rossellomorea marisflavi]
MFLDWLGGLNPALQALFGGTVTWGLTALGASAVFFFRKIEKHTLNMMLGFAAGVMIAASFWSLLAPSIEFSEQNGQIPWLAPAVGFLLGGLFIRLLDFVVPHLHLGNASEKAEGPPTKFKKSTLLFLAITLHNIPEGLAIGVAFGAAALGLGDATLIGAIGLAIGIGIQNMPEGAALSIPLRGEGMSRRRAFNYGQMSAIVEPIAAVIGAAAVLMIQPLLPYALAFAAGAMIFVVVEELIPESQSSGSTDLATLGLMAGFVVMMILDVSLG